MSIDVPAHWVVLSEANRSNVAAAGRALTELAGVDGAPSGKETLLAVNAIPAPTGAMIRVSVTKPPDYSEEELSAMTAQELKEVEAEVLTGFKKMESSGGPRIIELYPVRIETLNGKKALVLSYRRHSTVSASPWRVTQYKVPLPDRLVELTLSHRESDAQLWRPILEKVKLSLRY